MKFGFAKPQKSGFPTTPMVNVHGYLAGNLVLLSNSFLCLNPVLVRTRFMKSGLAKQEMGGVPVTAIVNVQYFGW